MSFSYFGSMIAKIKSPLRSFYHELKLINFTGKNKLFLRRNSNALAVHLDSFFMNTDMGRYSFILCQYLKFCGFPLIVKIDKAFVGQLAPPYKKLFLKQNHKLVRSCTAQVNTVEMSCADGSRKVIHIRYGYKYIGTHDSGSYYLPYPLHPKFYITRNSVGDLIALRNQRRNTLIFFAGNSDSRLYDGSVLQEEFPGTVSRLSALNFINARFDDRDTMELVTEPVRLYELLDGEGKQIVLSEARTPGEDWLQILGKAHFFLCLPGVRMPWSHNAIEAMSVGTIPIIQYGSLFTPPLEHMKNAVCYSSQQELGEVIDIVKNLPMHEIARLKANVIGYYEEHLSTDQVVRTIARFFSSNESSLSIVIPFLEDPEN